VHSIYSAHSSIPRFERKAAAEQKHIYYEGEYCEAEELPNGFTKIRFTAEPCPSDFRAVSPEK
jgi:hypothetical protein